MARIVAAQEGVIALEQLLACGLTYEQIRRRVERGLLHRIHQGVYGLGKISARGRLRAALLTCGPDSFLSHRTAAALRGLRDLNPRRVEVTVPRKLRRREGLILHRTTKPPHKEDLSTRDGLRLSSVARMLIELAATERPAELDRIITQCVRKNIFDLAAIERAMLRHPRHPGTRKLDHALRHYRHRPDRKSNLEKAFDALIEGTEVPQPKRNVEIDVWELDCYWPEFALAVELDGRPYHDSVADMEKDRYRDGKLLRMGIRTLRITDLRMEHDAKGVLEDVRALTIANP